MYPEVAELANLREIPDAVKWRKAAGCAARLPALYERAFRSVIGDRYDGLEQEVWMELSRISAEIAHELTLPVRNAVELSETMGIIMTVLFGPLYKSEVLKLDGDRAVTVVQACPFIEEGIALGCTGDCLFHRCLALTLTSIPRLNKNYEARYIRTMCTGDRQCEIKIEVREAPEGA